MPIEIKELIIRATISDESAKANSKGVTSPVSSQGDASREEEIVSRCVEQVMEILKIKDER